MTRKILPIASAGETTQMAWSLLKSRRTSLVAAVLAFSGAGAASMVAPWMLGTVVDAVRTGGDPATIHRAATTIVLAAVAGAGLSALSLAFLAHAAEPALATLRETVLDKALHLDVRQLEDSGAGDILSRVGDDVRTVAESVVDIVPLVVNSLIAIMFTGIALFALDWRLGLSGLGAMPMYVLALLWYLPRSAPVYRRERIAQGERAEALITGIHGASTLRAFGRDEAWLARINSHSRRAMALSVDVFRILTRFVGRNNRAELVGLLLVLGVGFLLVRDDLVTVGAATAAALYFHRLFNPIGGILVTFDQVQSAGASLARLVGVAGMTMPERHEETTRLDRPMLVLRGVGHAYDDLTVLSDINVTLAPGERVALVGATGAGKSTLGAIAAGHLRPTHGSVTLGGSDVRVMEEKTLRANVALVTQEVHVFTGTVRDNVTLARADATDAEVERAFETVLATTWIRALPDGLDTMVGDHGHRLTAAQAQQLALARVVLQDPPVAVLDEATAEAGSSGARDIEAAAFAATAGRSSLIVAHRLTQARSADRILVMHEGRVVGEGDHDALVASGGRYADLWQAWSR